MDTHRHSEWSGKETVYQCGMWLARAESFIVEGVWTYRFMSATELYKERADGRFVSDIHRHTEWSGRVMGSQAREVVLIWVSWVSYSRRALCA